MLPAWADHVDRLDLADSAIKHQFDRVPRTESYVKDFRPLSLGSMKLPKGRGSLLLRALDLAGKQVADIRYVSLNFLR